MTATLPAHFKSEEELDEVMTIPPPALIELMKKLDGDIAILGIGGKMGTTLGYQAVKACAAAKVKKKIIGVSRFSDPAAAAKVKEYGMETIACDLLERDQVAKLPQVPNVIFMAGKKFGTTEDASQTWAMNTVVPANVAQHYAKSRIVAFSTGNIYGFSSPVGCGAAEDAELNPQGDYGWSCLGRERTFQFYCRKNKTPTALIRLSYAIDMRYGVLYEVGQKVWRNEPFDVTVGHANVIWQGDANAQTLLALDHCTVPANIFNVTGPEMISLRALAIEFGKLMGRKPNIIGNEGDKAIISNTNKASRTFGYPTVTLQQMIEWTVHWIKNDGRSLNKPTHFEAKDGKY